MDLTDLIRKYRWFYTSNDRLVLAGKSSTSNDSLLKELKKHKKQYLILHTKNPGSPFSAIIEKPERVSEQDIKEAAIFTACFSQDWKKNKRTSNIDLFYISDTKKSIFLKPGTWRVKRKIREIKSKLALVLTSQNGKLRSVPEETIKNSERLAKVLPGDKTKEESLEIIKKKLKNKFKNEEILSALPPGGIKIT